MPRCENRGIFIFDNKLIESFARSIFSSMAALKIVSKCSFTACKLRFFDDFCLALTKNIHRAKLSKNQTPPLVTGSSSIGGKPGSRITDGLSGSKAAVKGSGVVALTSAGYTTPKYLNIFAATETGSNS